MHATLRWLLILGCFLGGVAHMAHADSRKKPASAEARRHLAQGNKLYNIRSFDQAIEEYKAGALVEEAPVFDYNLGQCYRQLGKYQEAIWHYERFLNRGDHKGEVVDAVNGFLAQMKAELDKKAMTQKPTEPGLGPSTPSQELQPSPITPQRTQPTPVIVHGDPWYVDRIGWALTGVGVVGLGFGGWMLSRAADLDNEANITTRQDVGVSLHDRATTRRIAGAVIGIVGVGLVVGGVVKLAIRQDDRKEPVGPSWHVGITGNSVAVFGHF